MAETSPLPSEPKDRKPRSPSWLRWTGFAVSVVGAAVLAWYVVDAMSRRRLATARAAFGAHGLPMEIKEILPPPVREDENADALLRQAWQTMTGSRNWETATVAPVFQQLAEIDLTHARPAASALQGGPPEFSAEQLNAAAVLLGDPMVEKCIEQLHQAMTLPTWRQHLEYEEGSALMLPQVSALRSFIRLLARRAAVRGQSPNDAEAAWDDLLAAWKLGDWADVEPTLISFLTGVAARGMIEPHALTLLSSGQTPAQLDRFIALQNQTVAELPARFVRAVQAERLGMFDALARDFESRSDWTTIEETLGHSPRPRWLAPWLNPIVNRVGRPRLRHELAICYAFQLRTETVVVAGGRDMISRLQDISDAVARDESILAKNVLPSLSRLAAGHFAHVTKQRALLALSVSVQRYRNAGTWPATISDLGLPEELTIDACSHQPLVLRAEDGWLVAYGFGFDGDDDGGRALPPADLRDGDGDIALRVRRHE